MKKLTVLAVAGLLIALYQAGTMAGQAWANVKGVTATPDLVEQAFQATGAIATGFEIHDWTTQNTAFLPVSVLQTQAKGVMVRLRADHITGFLHSDAHQHVSFLSGHTSVKTATGKNVPLTATVELASMHLLGQSPQTVLVIRLLSNQHTLAGSHAAFSLLQSVIPIKGSSNRNEMVFGQLSRMASKASRTALIDKAFADVAGHATQWSQDAYTTSAAGSSAKEGLYLPIGNQNITLQVAMHTNGYNQTTRVLVGSPLITVEY